MRRKDREITDLKTIESILAHARVLHLGLSDHDIPYVVPMHYGYTLTDGRLTFYLHSAREGRKLDILRANPNVFVALETDVTPISGGDKPCGYGAAYASVMGGGRAALVEDAAEKARALALLMRAQTGREFAVTEEMAAGVAVIRVDIDRFTAKGRPTPEAKERE